MPGTKKEKDPRMGLVGGQAVLEGVMMRSGDRCALSVRRVVQTAENVENAQDAQTAEAAQDTQTAETAQPAGTDADAPAAEPKTEIKTICRTVTSVRKKYRICDFPIIRGCVTFVEQLKLSMDTLTKSAEMQGIELDEPETKFEKWLDRKFGGKVMNAAAAVGSFLGVVLAVVLFILFPLLAAKGIDSASGGFVSLHPVLRSAIEGLIRIAIFVLYIWGVSFIPDIRRTFEYHGAEHKSVACFEKGLELTPANAKGCTRFHPRCGTSFIFVMLIISIIINSFIIIDVVWIRMLTKLVTIPLIVGIGYEFIRYAGCHSNVFTKILSAPGLWMQRITTKEPDEDQLEVALTALRYAIPEEFGGIRDEAEEGPTSPEEKPVAETAEDDAE